jgi:hypothetical protein
MSNPNYMRRMPKGFNVLSREERMELRAKSPNKGIYYRDMARLARLKEERDKDTPPPSFSS